MASRRAFLALGAVGLAYWGLRSGGPALWSRYGPLPEFERGSLPKGFRRIAGNGALSGGLANPLAGIDIPGTPAPEPLTLSDAELCRVLFDDTAPGKTRLNYFTDYNCPYCRELGRSLKDLAARLPDRAELRYHELPLLGEGSVIGARAALAARRQGAYDDMHRLLNTGVVRINEGYVMRIARELGLDEGKLRADMEGPTTERTLAEGLAVADRFYVIGTPFLLVGRTAIYGQINPALLERLITSDRARGNGGLC